jgi:hypothetical protein
MNYEGVSLSCLQSYCLAVVHVRKEIKMACKKTRGYQPELYSMSPKKK